MITYEEYEKKIYDWLLIKRKKDNKFNFSVRVKASKGSQTDYFIGTKKSNYFSTTFWSIPVGFPGSSAEAISLIFGSKKEYFGYNFEFKQTNSPDDLQNEYVLELIKSLKDTKISQLGYSHTSKPNNKMFSFKTKHRQKSYTALPEMLNDIEKDLEIILPIVDKEIVRLKSKYPEFIAHRITDERFKEMHDKLEERFIKYKGEVSEESEIYNSQKFNPKDEVVLPLNQILYGPPGTGKTYTAKEMAVRIANPELFANNTSISREDISQEYKELADSGQIVFTTFHQSLSYEDFIEGIKPVIDVESNSSDVSYQIEKGIFKKLCDKAKGIESSIDIDNSIDFNKKDYYKMSVGGKNRPEVHQYCLENNKILLGWGENENFEDYKNVKDWNNFRDKFENEFPDLIENSRYHIQAVYIFQKMKIGDIVLVSYGNHVIDAIGIIESEYTFDPDNKFGYNHSRKVRWLSKNMNASPDLFIDKNISQQSVYQFNKQDVKIENFLKSFHNYNTNLPKEKKHVLIIDEINRGNVSAIFGELITLLEEDKRKNAKEEIEVTLPYSKEIFSIPPNLYIIGTMNTADRSVEALDTALRRRFAFEELMPKPELFEGLEVGGISIQEVLEKINQRIEALVDRDHTIGHAYFFKVKDAVNKEEALKLVFKDNIIPLLQEYFYGDYSRIGLVLGGGFVEVERRENSTRFANVEGLENELEVPPRIQLIPINEAFDIGKALQNLMQDA